MQRTRGVVELSHGPLTAIPAGRRARVAVASLRWQPAGAGAAVAGRPGQSH